MDFFQRALALNTAIGRHEGQVNALIGIGNCYRIQEQISEALDVFQRALAIAEGIGSLEGQATALAYLGIYYRTRNEAAKSIEAYQRALALFRQVGLPETHPNVSNLLQELSTDVNSG